MVNRLYDSWKMRSYWKPTASLDSIQHNMKVIIIPICNNTVVMIGCNKGAEIEK